MSHELMCRFWTWLRRRFVGRL